MNTVIRRNKQPLKARSPGLLLMSLAGNGFIVILSCLRFAIGRYTYPCFLYMLSFFLMQPGVFLPPVLRSWRLFWVYKSSSQKQEVQQAGLSRDQSMVIPAKPAAQQNKKEIELKQSAGRSDAFDDIAPVVVVSAPATPTDPSALAAASVELPQSQDVATLSPPVDHRIQSPDTSSAASLESGAAFVGFKEEQDDDDGDEGVAPNASTEESDRRKSVDFRYGMSHQERVFRLYHILASTPFLTCMFIVIWIVHIIIWLGVAFSEITQDFRFDIGCVTTTKHVVIAVVEVLVYLGVNFVLLLALVFGRVRDRYNLRAEQWVVFIQWVIFVIIFFVWSLVPTTNRIVEYYFPGGFWIFFACFLDSFFSVFLPLVLSFSPRLNRRKRANENMSEIRRTLYEHDLRKMFKQYTIECFAPESLLCWEAIDHYKRIKSMKRRLKFGRDIVRKFLGANAVFPLNTPSEFKNKSLDIQNMLERREDAPLDAFDALQSHCEMDLLDMFSRFKTTPGYQKKQKKLAQLEQNAD